MITFEQARAIVADNLPDAVVAEWGWENSTDYQLEVFPPPRAVPQDGPRVTVNKSTGEFSSHYGLEEDGSPFWIPDKVPCGGPNPDDELEE